MHVSETLPDIEQAVAILSRGGLVAFPTETVYGLGADASNPDAVSRLYEVKGRPASHPVIVHVADIAQVEHWATQIPESAYRLAETFWPGPMTLILRRAAHVLVAVTGGQDTVGIRIPRHPIALALLREFKGGVAAPSANRFGCVSPTTAAHVRADLGQDVDLILDGGPCEVGLESTIIDFTGKTPQILRPGMLSRPQLEAVLDLSEPSEAAETTRAPGTLASHYAPQTSIEIVPPDQLERRVQELLGFGAHIAVMAHGVDVPARPNLVVVPASRFPADYARSLYRQLREMDRFGCDMMLIEAVPADPAWAAIHDRLMRAAAARE